ncbi:MAG: glycosyltransferase family 4 protein, partial [Balneolales bacterium]|nr:glycosyltransferase family 4 protein [Balneolales bacterium]
MKRLLYVISSLVRSGPVNQMVSLLRHLPDWDVHVLALSPDPVASRKSELQSMGVTVHEIPMGAPRFWLGGRSRFARFVDGLKPDLIHTAGIRGDWLGASVAQSYPTVSTIHNIPWEDYAFTYGRLVSSVMLPVHRRAWAQMYTCVGVSAHVAEMVQGWAPEARVIPIPNGIDMDVFGVKAGVLNSERSRIDASLVRDDELNVRDADQNARDAEALSNPSHRALDARSR